jgi:hypothetical protein
MQPGDDGPRDIAMTPTSIRIQYFSLRSEVWRFYWRSWRQRLWKFHLFIFGSFTVVVFVCAILGGTAPSVAGVNAFGWGLLSIVWLPLYPLLKFKPQMRVLEISAEGISTAIGKLSARRSWHEIASITEADGNFVILGKNGNAFIVPPRAFDSDNSRLAFLAFAQSAFAASC